MNKNRNTKRLGQETHSMSQLGEVVEEDEECGKCGKKVGQDEKAVLCDICKIWYHQACGGIHEDLYRAIEQFGYKGTGEIPWQCRVCKKYASQMIAEMVQIKQKQEKQEKKMKEMEKKVNNTEKEMKEIRKEIGNNREEISKVKEEIKNEKEVQPQNMEISRLKKRIKEEVSEEIDREKRRNRIVISNLVTEATEDERKNQVKQLFQNLDIPEDCIVGQVVQLKDKRFVSIKLANTEIKNRVLRKAKTLRNKEQYSEVYIRPDLTYRQRKEEQKLREEMKFRILKGEKNLKIRNGQLVQIIEIPQGAQGGSGSEEEPFHEDQ